MSIGDMLTAGMEACVRLVRAEEVAALGTEERFSDGEGFLAYLRKDASPEQRAAERQGMKEQYTVIVPGGVELRRDDVFRRERDGAVFVCTSSTGDARAPERSTLDIAECGAVRWEIPQ